jgi:hypothetical protein
MQVHAMYLVATFWGWTKTSRKVNLPREGIGYTLQQPGAVQPSGIATEEGGCEEKGHKMNGMSPERRKSHCQGSREK